MDIAFPPPYSATDVASITVRGTAGDQHGVAGVLVNGVPAITTNDYATWEATVPLAVGPNTLEVETVDLKGNRNPVAARLQVDRSLLLLDGTGMAIDPAEDRVYALSRYDDMLVAYHLETGHGTIISSPERGSGPVLASPVAVALDAENGRALVLDDYHPARAVLSVDLATGDRTIVSDASSPGPAFLMPLALALDTTRNRALVVDYGHGVVAVDLATGARHILSGTEAGAGPAFSAAWGGVLDEARDRLLVTDLSLDAVVAVDLATGDRTIISGQGIGSGLSLVHSWNITLDAANDRALILDYNRRDYSERIKLIAVDLATGNRTKLAAMREYNFHSPMPVLRGKYGIVLDAARNRVLSPDYQTSALVALDMDTGKRVIATKPRVGAGPRLYNTSYSVLDAMHDRAVIAETEIQALVTVDLPRGHRSILSGAGVGTGPAIDDIAGLALDAPNNRVMVVDRNGGAPELLAVSLSTGDRSLVVDLSGGAEPVLEDPYDLVLDPANDRALVLVGSPFNGVVAVDLSTGARTPITSRDVGSGPLLTGRALLLDAARNRLLVSQSGFYSPGPVFAVDLATGDRSVFTSKEHWLVGDDDYSYYDPEIFADLSMDEANNRIVAVSDISTDIYAIDLDTGTPTKIAGEGMGQGPYLRESSSGVLDPDNDRLLVADPESQAVIGIDLPSGERVIVSR